MNKEYLPILGNYQNNKLSIVIISLFDKKIKINNIEYTLLKNDIISIQIEINSNGINIINIDDNKIELNMDDDIKKRIKIFNCDCNFVPETGIWNKIYNDKPFYSFHLGDQIYNDLIFLKHCRLYNSISKIDENLDKIKSEIINNYITAYKRKISILQHSFNIFIGDDHDIMDDSMIKSLDPIISAKLKQIYREIFEKIKTGLIDTNLLHLDNKSILLFDNIDTCNYKEYSKKLNKLIKENVFKETLYIMSPRVLLNFKSSLIDTVIYETASNNNEYDELYDTIFSLNSEVKIFCGDAHYISKYNIKDKNNKKSELYLVGPINSVLAEKKCNYTLYDNNYKINNEYEHIQHGYISIDNYNIIHNKYICWINKLLGSLIYVLLYFWAKYFSK